MPRLTLAALGLLLAFSPGRSDDKPKQPDTNFDNLKPLAEGIARADKVILYEGLPHQSDKLAFDKELKEKKTVEFNGFPFYAETLELKADDAKKLTELATAAGSFSKWHGPK